MYVLHKTNRVTVQGDLPGNATFEEWLKSAESTIGFNLVVPESKFRDELQIQTYAKQLASDGLYYNGHIAIAPDEIATGIDEKTFSYWGKMVEYFPWHYGKEGESQEIWLEG